MSRYTQRAGVQECLAADARFDNRCVALIVLRETIAPDCHAKRLARIVAIAKQKG